MAQVQWMVEVREMAWRMVIGGSLASQAKNSYYHNT